MKKCLKLSASLVFFTLLLAPQAGRAAVEIFLLLDGISGESVKPHHEEEIDILGWSWGLTQSGTTHVSGGAGAGTVTIQDMTITKYVDKATPQLLLHCSNGQHIPAAVLTVQRAGPEPAEFYRITLDDVLVSSVQQGGEIAQERFTEQIKLNFAKVTVEYVLLDSEGNPRGTEDYFWDIKANTGE